MAERMTPPYKDLPVIEKTGYRHAWGVFGDGDELGNKSLASRKFTP